MRLHALLALGFLVGCSAQVIDEGEGPDAHDASTFGSVSVERSEALRGAVRTRVSASFMRVSGAIDQRLAREIVVPTPTHQSHEGGLAMDGCLLRADARERLPSSISGGAIELLDVGEIAVRSSEAEDHVLAPRAFPDVGDLVGGIIYTSRDDTGALSAGLYTIETAGSDDVDAFVVQARAPEPPHEVEIAGEALRPDFELTVGEPLALSWRRGGSGDVIVVEIDGDGTTVSCRFEDDGVAVVPESFVLPEHEGAIELTVRRLRRVTVEPPGLDSAVIDFVFSVTANGIAVH